MSPEELNEKLLYNVLQDNLFILGSNAILKMNVILYREEKNNHRQYYYTETQYVDKNGYLARRTQRQINAFVSIENLRSVHGVNEFIILRGRDLELLRLFLLPKLEAIIQNFNKIFEKREEKLYCNDIVKPIEIVFSTKEKTIWLKPGLHQLYSDEIIPCMELYLNSPNNMSVLSFPMVYEFMYFIRTFNIYEYATSMLSCFGMPPMGYNLIDNSYNQVEHLPEKKYNYEEQKPLKLKPKMGFFDKEIKKREGEQL